MTAVAWWLATAFVAAWLVSFLAGVAVLAWDGLIAPRLIPRAKIRRLAAQTIARCDDPEEAARIEERHYRHRCDGFEHGKWRRVRREIQRRLAAS